jgi:SAM-dependent methyltransferase
MEFAKSEARRHLDQMRQLLKSLLKDGLPMPMQRWARRVQGVNFTPPVGTVDFGDFRRLRPISREYGYDRGRPIDRYYVETLLEQHASLIRGHVLEIGDNTYTRTFGGDRVTESDVLHAYEVPEATIVGDLADMSNVPSDSFDCLIITQTLHLIFEIEVAFQNLYRILKPGGTLLATFPGLSQISDNDWRDSWYWGFTVPSAEKLITAAFPPSHVEIRSHGNALASVAFLFGMADSELTQKELNFHDPDYQLLLTVRATKPRSDDVFAMRGRWDYSEAAQFPYDDQASYRKGIAFLDGHGTIEDWGCGTAFAKRFIELSDYIGIDGSESPYVDKVVDLQTYCSDVDCIFMRHVLEHNYGWHHILKNAVNSFRKRMVLILFTPFSEAERRIGENKGIPDLSLRREKVLSFFEELVVAEESLESATEYGHEYIFYVEKP